MMSDLVKNVCLRDDDIDWWSSTYVLLLSQPDV